MDWIYLDTRKFEVSMRSQWKYLVADQCCRHREGKEGTRPPNNFANLVFYWNFWENGRIFEASWKLKLNSESRIRMSLASSILEPLFKSAYCAIFNVLTLILAITRASNPRRWAKYWLLTRVVMLTLTDDNFFDTEKLFKISLKLISSSRFVY